MLSQGIKGTQSLPVGPSHKGYLKWGCCCPPRLILRGGKGKREGLKALLECSGQTGGLNRGPPTLSRPTSHPPPPADMLVLSNVPFSPSQAFLRGNPPSHMPTQDRVPGWLEPVPRFCPLSPWREAEQVRDTGETAPVQDQSWAETLQSRPLAALCLCAPLIPGHPCCQSL